VLYIALEGEIGFYNRLKAYVSKVIGDILPDAPFKIVTVPVDFGIDATTSQIAVAKVIATINEMNIEAQRIGAPKVGVFVLDNMRSAAPGLRENYSEEVAAFYGKCREVARATGASPIVIQNTGKDTTLGARGTQAQFDLCDTVIEISSEPRSWIATKTRDGAISKALAFALEVIDLGIVEDVDGSDKMIRSVVARPAEFPDPPAKPKPQWQRAHDVLVRTVANHGMKPPDTVNYPTTTPVITTTRFREELQKVDLLPQDPDVRLTVRARESALSVIRARYSELRKKLADKGLMSLYELYVWPTTPGPKK
jgi:hypothetical protein